MPGTLQAPAPTATFPSNLSTKFTESHAIQANWNEYNDGTTQAFALATGGRRTWKLAKRLTASEMVQLRDLWRNNLIVYYYNPYETNPPFARVPSGTEGRYVVRFTSDWDETFSMVRSDTQCELVEIAAGDNFQGGILAGNPSTPPAVSTASLSVGVTLGVQPTGYTGYPLVTYSVGSSSGVILSNGTTSGTVNLTTSIADLSTLSVGVEMGGTLFYDGAVPGGTFTLNSLVLTVVLADGTTATVTPQVAYIVAPEAGSATVGTIINPGIGATIQRWHVSGLTSPQYLVLTGFNLPA
jgi:hypothetical protein